MSDENKSNTDYPPEENLLCMIILLQEILLQVINQTNHDTPAGRTEQLSI